MQVQVRMRIRIQAHSMNEGTTTTAELSKSQLVTRAEQEQGPRDRDGPKRMAGRGAAYCAGRMSGYASVSARLGGLARYCVRNGIEPGAGGLNAARGQKAEARRPTRYFGPVIQQFERRESQQRQTLLRAGVAQVATLSWLC